MQVVIQLYENDFFTKCHGEKINYFITLVLFNILKLLCS